MLAFCLEVNAAGYLFATPGAAGALGAPGAAGMPGAPAAPGAPGAGMPATPGIGIALSGNAVPHSGHCVSVGSHVCPHEGQILSFEIAAGLKHILRLLSLSLFTFVGNASTVYMRNLTL